MGKAADTLAWLDSHKESVDQHSGAAFEECELLRLMLSGASGTGGVMSAAYRNKLAKHIPSLIEREDARGYAHVVMFASDFGLDPVVHPSSVNPLFDEAVKIHQEDTDTLGELLIAAFLLNVQSLAIEQAKSKFDQDWAAISRESFDNYHPILVGGILYALRGE